MTKGRRRESVENFVGALGKRKKRKNEGGGNL